MFSKSLSAFTTNPEITIRLRGVEGRTKKSFKVPKGEPIMIPVYFGQEVVSGEAEITVPAGKKVEHQGIRIEMIGQTGKIDCDARY